MKWDVYYLMVNPRKDWIKTVFLLFHEIKEVNSDEDWRKNVAVSVLYI